MSMSRAEKVSQIALNYLRHYRLSPTPENYAVVYAWTKGTDQDLGRFLKSRAGKDAHAVSELLLQEAHAIFVGQGRALERLERWVAQGSGALDAARAAMVSLPARQAGMAKAFAAGLRHLRGREDVPAEVKEIMGLAEAVLEATREAQLAMLTEIDAARRELAALREDLAQQTSSARTCPLTGLANRRAFDETIRRVLDLDGERVASLVVLDVDHLKKVNDLHGHAAGDAVLRRVGQAVRDAAAERAEVAVAARFGGEEFALLTRADLPAAVALARELRGRIEAAPLDARRANGDPVRLQVTASLGVAGRQEGDDPDGLVDRAELNLSAAKRQGRNRVVHD